MTRRRWLATAPVVSSALVASVSAQERSTVESRTECTLGFGTYGMKSLTTEKAIETIEKIGFDALEITVREGWDADSAAISRTRRSSLRKRISDSKLRLTSLMEHVFPLAKHQVKAVERLKLAARLAHDLAPEDPPLIQTVLGSGDFEKSKMALVDGLAEWLKIAEDTKTLIAIKPHRGGIVSKPSQAIWLLEQLGKPQWMRMVYDYSHYAFRDLPLQETVATALPFTSHIAVKDAVREGDRVIFKLPGEAGTIDFAALIRQFHAGGYRGDFNCEVSGMVWNQKGYDPMDAAKKCYAAMSKAFQDAGVPRSM